MTRVDALLFDLDGTLVDSRLDLANSVRHLQRHYGAKRSSLTEVASFIGDGVVKLVQRALPHVMPKEIPKAVDYFKAHYRKHCLEHTRAYPGVKKMLEHFKDKKLAIVTNKPYRLSAQILHGLGLESYFDVLVGGDSLPEKKPHPEPIRNALRTLGIKPSKRVVMVGDGPHDVLSGRAAKILTCGVKSNIAPHQILLKSRPDFIIDRMSKLARIFN